MKKRCLALVVAICFLAAFFTGCGDSETEGQETAVVTRGDLLISIPVSGNLEMPRKMDLSFGTTGTVEEIMVEEGDMVSKDEVLVKLDARSQELTVAMAQAGLKAAQAAYELAEADLMETIYPHFTSRHGIDLPGVWLALDEAQNNLEEARKLLNEGKTDEAEDLLEQVEQNVHEAQQETKARVWQVPLSVKLKELQLKQAEASLDIAKAELALAKLELDKARIVAPFDGLIAEVDIKEGKQLYSMTYTNPAIDIINLSDIKMSGVIDEIDIAQVRLGQEAIVILDALPEREIEGKVTFISQRGTIEAGVVSYKTTVTLETATEGLRDGMSATADILIERDENVLLVRNRVIQGSLAQPWVEVVTPEGNVERRDITIGLSDGIVTEVLSGLTEGEKVVLHRVSALPFTPFGG